MADDKKKEGGGSKPPHPAYPPIAIFAIAMILAALLAAIQRTIYGNSSLRTIWLKFQMLLNGDITFGEFLARLGAFSDFLFFFKVLSFIACIVLLWFIGTTIRKLTKLNIEMRKVLHPPVGTTMGDPSPYMTDKPQVNPRWEKVIHHVNSSNPSEWKLAILEADIILSEMIEKMGYHGETIGDKLKKIERSDFNTIDNAWEAHRIRNSIAHEGSDFLLSEREARRIVGLYQSVFEEFKYI